jgi:hypothetical protein
MIHLVEQLEKAAEKAFERMALLEKENRDLAEKLSALELTLLEKDDELEKAQEGGTVTEQSVEKVQRLEEERDQVQHRLSGLLERYRSHIRQEEE